MRYVLLLLNLIFALVPGLSLAKPTHYFLEADRSTVGFEVDWGREKILGRMPIVSADLSLDFDRVAGSAVRVTIGTPGASTNNLFATQTMAGATVLDATRYPTIEFQSTKVRKNGEGALIEGVVTIRGVSKPMTLSAQVYRQVGTDAGERDRLSIQLTGKVNRSEFGATGWSDLIGDEVRLTILARINRDK